MSAAVPASFRFKIDYARNVLGLHAISANHLLTAYLHKCCQCPFVRRVKANGLAAAAGNLERANFFEFFPKLFLFREVLSRRGGCEE